MALLGPIELMGFMSGTVLDPEGTPLEGVAIFELNHPDLLAFSNSQGEFDLGLFVPEAPVENLSLAVGPIPSRQLIATSPPSKIDGTVFNGKVTFPGPFFPGFRGRPKTEPQTLGKKTPKQALRERVELLCGPEASQNRKLIQTAKEMLDKSIDDFRNKIKSDLQNKPPVPITGPAKITDRTPQQVSASLLTKKQIVESVVIDPGSFQPLGIGSKFDPTKLEFGGVSLKVEDFRATLRHTRDSIGFAHVSSSKLDKDLVVRAEIQGISNGQATVTGSATSVTAEVNITANLSLDGDLICPEGISLKVGLSFKIDKADIDFQDLKVEVDLPPATIAVSPSSLSFSTVQGVNPEPQELTLTNTGESILRYSIQDTSFWLIESPLSGSLDPGKSTQIKVTVTAGGLAAEDDPYTDTITISDPAASNNPQTVSVSLQVDPIPEGPFFLGVGKGGPGSGTVTSVPAGIDCGTDCSHLFDSGTPVTLTAKEKEGDSFTGWTGACTGSDPVCELTMDSDKATTAIFASSPFFLGVGKAGNGSGTVTSEPGKIDCGTTCSDLFEGDTVVTLTATPDSGSTFEGWSGACTGTGTCLLTMDEDKAVTATFETTSSPPTTFTLTVSKLVASDLELGGMPDNDGTLDPAGISCGSDCSENYESGTTVRLTATPASGSVFDGWSACSGTGTCLVTMNSDKAVTAFFSQETPGGSLSGTWQGPYTFTVDLQGLCQPGFTLIHSGTLTMALSQSGTSFSGSGTVTGVKDLSIGLVCSVVNDNLTFGGSISGTLSGQSVTGQINFSNPDLGVVSFSGTLSGTSITGGTLTSPDGAGTFSATKQ